MSLSKLNINRTPKYVDVGVVVDDGILVVVVVCGVWVSVCDVIVVYMLFVVDRVVTRYVLC